MNVTLNFPFLNKHCLPCMKSPKKYFCHCGLDQQSLNNQYYFSSDSCLRRNDSIFRTTLRKVMAMICLLFLLVVPMYGQDDLMADPTQGVEVEDIDYEQYIDAYLKKLKLLYKEVINKDTTDMTKQDAESCYNEYDRELKKINKKDGFIEAEKYDKYWIGDAKLKKTRDACIDTRGNIETEIVKKFNPIINRPDAPVEEEKTPWYVIIGMALGALLVVSMTIMPLITKKTTEKKLRESTKASGWQALNMRYQTLPQNLELSHMSLLDDLISEYTKFKAQPPKKLHEEDADKKIQELKSKKFKITPKITI